MLDVVNLALPFLGLHSMLQSDGERSPSRAGIRQDPIRSPTGGLAYIFTFLQV